MYYINVIDSGLLLPQVTKGSNGFTCTYNIFRLVAGTADLKCLDTVYVQAIVQSAQCNVADFHPPSEVVPVRPLAPATAPLHAYWVDNAFVFKPTLSQCSVGC